MKLTKSNHIKFILNPIMVGMLGLSLQVHAEQEYDNDYGMIVTANRSGQNISDIAATVQVIEEEQIVEQAQSGVEFKDLLANLIPSLDVGSQSRSNAGQNMRGRTALVMIDGVSLQSSRLVSRYFDSINPFNIARIEVVAGATAIFGGGSTGGIINIITKKGSDEEGTHYESWVSAQSGFNNSEDLQYQVAQSVSVKRDKLDARLAISYDKAEGAYDSNGDMIIQDPAQTGSQYIGQLDVMGSLGYEISETKRLELTAQFYDSGQDSDYGIDYGANYAYAPASSTEEVGMIEGYNLDDQASTTRYMLTANYSDSDFYNQTMNLQFFGRYESYRFNPFYAGTSISASEQNTTVFGSKLVFTSNPIDKLNLVYGIDAEFEKSDTTQHYYDLGTAGASNGLTLQEIGTTGRYPDVETTSLAGFVQADYDVNSSLNIHSGLRYQYTHTQIGDFVASTQQSYELGGLAPDGYFDEIEGGTNNYGNLLVNVGALYKINKAQQVWFNFSQGFEIPDSAKYYGVGSYNADGSVASSVNVSDSPLEGIKTNSVELGWRLHNENLSTQLTAYYSLSDKSIEVDKTDYSIDLIDDKKRIYGLEAQLDYYLTEEVSAGGNFNYIVSETKSDGKWSNLDATTASPSKLTAYVSWHTEEFNTRIQTTQLFDYTDGDDKDLNGYNTVDLLAGIGLPVGKVQFGITNLLNTEYQTLWSQRANYYYNAAYNDSLFNYEGQGRTYSVNYNVKF